MKIINGISTGFNGNIEGIKGRNDPAAINAALTEMESLFAYEMIKAMRATTGSSSDSGFGNEAYMSMFDMEIARLLAGRGLGLKEMLMKGLIREPGVEYKELNIQNANYSASRTINPSVQSSVKPSAAASAESDVFPIPVDGVISSHFGVRRHPIYGDNRFHYGIDIAADEGTSIYALRPGRVVFSGEQGGYGNMVIVDHGDGYITKYAHNKVNLVKEGDVVESDTVIAQVGSTGLATGPHLHFEIKRNGEHVDPVTLIAKR